MQTSQSKYHWWWQDIRQVCVQTRCCSFKLIVKQYMCVIFFHVKKTIFSSGPINKDWHTWRKKCVVLQACSFKQIHLWGALNTPAVIVWEFWTGLFQSFYHDVGFRGTIWSEQNKTSELWMLSTFVNLFVTSFQQKSLQVRSSLINFASWTPCL